MPTLPSHSLAQNTSGFSDVPHCLNSERGRWARNCAMYELSGIMSILFCIISRSIFLGRSAGQTPSIYTMDTAVSDFLPVLSILT